MEVVLPHRIGTKLPAVPHQAGRQEADAGAPYTTFGILPRGPLLVAGHNSLIAGMPPSAHATQSRNDTVGRGSPVGAWRVWRARDVAHDERASRRDGEAPRRLEVKALVVEPTVLAGRAICQESTRPMGRRTRRSSPISHLRSDGERPRSVRRTHERIERHSGQRAIDERRRERQIDDAHVRTRKPLEKPVDSTNARHVQRATAVPPCVICGSALEGRRRGGQEGRVVRVEVARCE